MPKTCAAQTPSTCMGAYFMHLARCALPVVEHAHILAGLRCDLMSTADCQAYFKEHGRVEIEWLNDSACCAVFPDAAAAARVLVGMGRPLPPEAVAPEGSSEAQPPCCTVQACVQPGNRVVHTQLRSHACDVLRA